MDDFHTRFRSITRVRQAAAGFRCVRVLATGSQPLLALSACRDRRRATEGRGLLPPRPAGQLVPASPQPRTPYEKVGDATFARTIFQTAGPSKTAISIRDVVDFQCPYCHRGFGTVEDGRRKYGNKIRFVLKHLPLDFHPMAMPAAKRFEAIARQSDEKAYAFRDEVFANQDRLVAEGEKFLDATAEKVGVNVAKMKMKMKKEMESEGTRHIGLNASRIGIALTANNVEQCCSC